ncbi:DUF2516 family protein [Cellulomonas endophytica]|uniref:DUF2516 family protein n=1 Tax=Cellulomonas endophytica TaxID=2494735 RepID=UPI00101271EF|nr:DUF2516 family protein [Cellulomonas endophytica]
MVATIQYYIFLLLGLVVLGMAVWGLVDLLRRPAAAFVSAGKLTKTKWGLILGAATLLSFATLGAGGLPFLALLSAVAAGVYLADVKPAIEPYSRRGGRGPSGGGPYGGW